MSEVLGDAGKGVLRHLSNATGAVARRMRPHATSHRPCHIIPGKGALFETAVVEEVAKAYLARGRKPKLFYWRDAAGHEIDILIERGASLAWAIEVKNSATYSPKFFKNLDAVCDDIDVPVERRVVVYAGQETFETSHGLVCSFADLRRLDA